MQPSAAIRSSPAVRLGEQLLSENARAQYEHDTNKGGATVRREKIFLGTTGMCREKPRDHSHGLSARFRWTMPDQRLTASIAHLNICIDTNCTLNVQIIIIMCTKLCRLANGIVLPGYVADTMYDAASNAMVRSEWSDKMKSSKSMQWEIEELLDLPRGYFLSINNSFATHAETKEIDQNAYSEQILAEQCISLLQAFRQIHDLEVRRRFLQIVQQAASNE
jgi:hypothetical protein